MNGAEGQQVMKNIFVQTLGNRWKSILVLFMFCLLVALVSFCAPQNEQKQASAEFLNHNDTVDYVGIETCRQCHADIYNSFVKTGMGSSFGPADTMKSAMQLTGDSALYDTYTKFHYQPYWEGNKLFIKEFRLKGKDTAHLIKQYVDYIVGSGQHTNSHIYEVNNYLYQAPFTWYAQKGKLDMPPGFEKGGNSRFSRLIGLECMSCHNAMPTGFVKGSDNKFRNVPHGIDCERCHGPGELHVKGVQQGKVVDTAERTDYRIVNPAKLEAQLQFEICQRCHLQGNAVLQPGKSFFDFKPGMHLDSVMNVYLPKYSNAEDEFIMASHVDRFKQSRCFQATEQFNCIDCHNPHVSVKETKIAKFNNTCQSCHEQGSPEFCTATAEKLAAAENNCVQCHMPSSGSEDIPHVSIHDHRIQIPRKEKDTAGLKEFLGLFAINNEQPEPYSKARAYLQQYERFEKKPLYLDSAQFWIAKLSSEYRSAELGIYLNFLKKNYREIQNIAQQYGFSNLQQKLHKTTFDNQHAYTAYRVAEALAQVDNQERAVEFAAKSVELAPYVLDFRNKYASLLIATGEQFAAEDQWAFVLEENPYHRESLNNYGYYLLRAGRPEKGTKLIKRAVERYPDYEMAWLNLASAYLMQENYEKAKSCLEQVLRINPNNRRARQTLSKLQSS